jgi:hypothetical protein
MDREELNRVDKYYGPVQGEYRIILSYSHPAWWIESYVIARGIDQTHRWIKHAFL